MTILAVVASALLQTYATQAFIRLASLLSDGFTGAAILTDRIISLYGHNISTSLGILVPNIPVVVLRSGSVSMRFTLYSMLQVFLANLLLKIYNFEPLFSDVLLDVVLDGFLYGLSITIALRGSTFTGGMDFIALCVSNKTGRSIWEHMFVGNCAILCIFDCMSGWLYVGYSALSQPIPTRAISAFHHRCERVVLQVIITKVQDITNQYVKQYRYNISCVNVVGGYSHKKMCLPRTMVSSYEVNDIICLVREQDPHVVINMIKTEDFCGGFYQVPVG